MAIIDALSFDRGLHFNDMDALGTPTRDTTHYVDGGSSLRFPVGTSGYLNWVRHDFAQQQPTQPAVSMYIYPRTWYSSSEGDGFPRVYFALGSMSHLIDLRWNTYSYTHDLYLGGSLVESGVVSVAQNDWFSLQIWANIASSGGFVRVLVDGHESINYSGDTQGGGTAFATHCYVRAGKYSLTGRSGSNLDNWVLGEDEFLGDCHVDELVPNADVTAQYTPISGSDNYAMVNETPQNSATYNYAQTDGLYDLLGLEDWDDTTPNGINKLPVAVIPWIWGGAVTATGESMRVGLSSNGIIDDASFYQFMASRRSAHPVLLNPDGDVAWTKTAIDAALLRYEADLTA